MVRTSTREKDDLLGSLRVKLEKKDTGEERNPYATKGDRSDFGERKTVEKKEGRGLEAPPARRFNRYIKRGRGRKERFRKAGKIEPGKIDGRERGVDRKRSRPMSFLEGDHRGLKKWRSERKGEEMVTCGNRSRKKKDWGGGIFSNCKGGKSEGGEEKTEKKAKKKCPTKKERVNNLE